MSEIKIGTNRSFGIVFSIVYLLSEEHYRLAIAISIVFINGLSYIRERDDLITLRNKGIIDKLGKNVKELNIGEKVMGLSLSGSYSSHVCIDKNSIIAIHDGVRPLFTKNLLEKIFKKALNNKCVVPYIATKINVS